MAILITDPTLLLNGNSDAATTPGAELTIDTTAKTIKINTGAGDLPGSADGVTFQALYSALKILWKNSASYFKLQFPFEAITPEQYEVYNGWTFLDAATRKAIRTAGWSERNAGGAIVAMYAGVISLGSLGASDQAYFQQTSNGSAANFSFTGPVNEAVQIVSDPNGDGNYTDGFDNRSYFKIFTREQQKTYAAAQLTDIGVTSMSTIVYRFPLANAADTKVSKTDAQIVADSSTYSGITVTYYAVDQVRSIGGSNYNYRVIVNGNGKTGEQIYEKCQYLLRQSSDIDNGAGTVTGKTADALLRFVGDTLITSTGVYIDNFAVADTNRITFTDFTATGRTYPFVATVSISFNPNLVNDPSSVFKVYFTTNPAGNYGTDNAVQLQDASSTPIGGAISASSLQFAVSYDSNVQGGRTPGVDIPITVAAIGLTTGAFAVTTATLTRSTGQNVSVVASLERNFANS